VLINFYGLRILTDPVLFNRIGVDLGIGSFGPQRLVQCALAADEMPAIDLVLVSHAHFDHLDTPSLAERINAFPDPVEARRMFVARQPMGRLAKAEEIAPLVVFLASDEAAFITGNMYSCDGGMTI